jgi:hypothetical protein
MTTSMPSTGKPEESNKKLDLKGFTAIIDAENI